MFQANYEKSKKDQLKIVIFTAVKKIAVYCLGVLSLWHRKSRFLLYLVWIHDTVGLLAQLIENESVLSGKCIFETF